MLCVSSFQEREEQARKLLLEEERQRRAEAERQLQQQAAIRQRLVEKEVKMRAKNFSQVCVCVCLHGPSREWLRRTDELMSNGAR